MKDIFSYIRRFEKIARRLTQLSFAGSALREIRFARTETDDADRFKRVFGAPYQAPSRYVGESTIRLYVDISQFQTLNAYADSVKELVCYHPELVLSLGDSLRPLDTPNEIVFVVKKIETVGIYERIYYKYTLATSEEIDLPTRGIRFLN